jgi:rare lipoprotein A
MNQSDGALRSGWGLRCLFLFTLGALASCQSDGRKMAPGMFENVLSAMDSVLTGTPRAEDTPPESKTEIAVPMTPQASAAVDQPPVAPLSDAELDAESKHLGGDDLNFGSTDEGIRRPWNSPYEVFGDRYEVKKSSLGYVEVGIASWYGQKFQGRKTSNGEIFDMYLASAAHKSLPIPTMVRVTNLDNGRKIEVRVNDRGPFHDDRIIDLSFAAAKALGFSTQGTAPVVVEALDAINYPEKALKQKQAGPKIYLQAGAFQSKVSARNLKRDIEANLMLQRLKAVVRVLESEFEKDSTLHKVWIGPIQTSKNEAAVTRILVQMGLAKPVKVVAN